MLYYSVCYLQSLLLMDFTGNHFRNPYKEIGNTRKLDSIHEWHFVHGTEKRG